MRGGNLPRRISRSSVVELPRMTTSVSRMLDDTSAFGQLAEERSSGDLLLAPDSLAFGHPAWVAHSHESFFMPLDTGNSLTSAKQSPI